MDQTLGQSTIGLVSGPGSVSVPIQVDLVELRRALIAAQHPLSQAPEWTGHAIYMALIYEPINISGVLSETVIRIVHVMATAPPRRAESGLSGPIIQEVRDFVRRITKTKVVDESIHVTMIAITDGHKKVSDIKIMS